MHLKVLKDFTTQIINDDDYGHGYDYVHDYDHYIYVILNVNANENGCGDYENIYGGQPTRYFIIYYFFSQV